MGRLLMVAMGSLLWAGGARQAVGEAQPAATHSEVAATTRTRSIAEDEAAELMRSWLAPGIATRKTATSPGDNSGDWRRYGEILAEPDPGEREQHLRDLYRETPNLYLRANILRAISEDSDFQSRQAFFIRHYGFYANWFNRFAFSAGRLLQGNIQAMVQVTVDGMFDVFRPSEADPQERRALDLMKRADRLDQSQGRAANTPEKQKLEQAVARAQAEADLERADWALATNQPDMAAFYAQQAAELQPDWTKATQLKERAEAEAARQRREDVASAQVGYPDRQPAVDPADAELLRRILMDDGKSEITVNEPDKMLVEVVRGSDGATSGGAKLQSVAGMRRLEGALVDAPPDTPEAQRRWLGALVDDPAHNPDRRLAQARSRRHGQLWHYIFIGPERPREQARKTANWFTTAWSALGSVGVFYIFEVGGRAVQSAFVPPVPAEEVLDAEASWLKSAPEPEGKESRKVSRDLAIFYKRQRRYEDARQTLRAAGLLDDDAAEKINKAEARWLLTTAESLPAGPEREALVKRIKALAPDTRLARNADKLALGKKKKAPPQELRVSWSTLQRWTGLPGPCGLPGEAGWFDGDPANGEAVAEDVYLKRIDGKSAVLIRYDVNQQGRTTFQREVPTEQLPAGIRRWLDLANTQQTETENDIQQLHRLPIPFEIYGGAGPTGVDLYPKLRPIEMKPGEKELYQ